MLQQHAHCVWATTIINLIIFVAYGACWVCLCCHNPPNSDMDYTIFVHAIALGVCGHRKWVCTESGLWEKNPLPHRGIEPASAAWRSDAVTSWAASHPFFVFFVLSKLGDLMTKISSFPVQKTSIQNNEIIVLTDAGFCSFLAGNEVTEPL